MVTAWWRFIVNLPFNWAKNPTCMDIIWSMDTHWSGLVANFVFVASFPLKGSLVCKKHNLYKLGAAQWQGVWEFCQSWPGSWPLGMTSVHGNSANAWVLPVIWSYMNKLLFMNHVWARVKSQQTNMPYLGQVRALDWGVCHDIAELNGFVICKVFLKDFILVVGT